MKSPQPFGGIPFLGLGDFRQVAPVVKGTGATPALLASVKMASTWNSFHIFRLRTPIPSAGDPEYTDILDEVGENYSDERVSLDILDTVSTVDECISFLFPPDILGNPTASLKRAFLSPKNVNVDEFNGQVLDSVPGVDRPSDGFANRAHANLTTFRHFLQRGPGQGRRRA
jgi:hypothetical protein